MSHFSLAEDYVCYKSLKHITGFEGYIVSSDGFVWSSRTQWKGNLVRMKGWSRTHSAHRFVTLCQRGKHKHFQVHRLVLQAFVGPCPVGLMSRHLDGNAENNHVSNLRWGTSKENAEDARRHGTLPFGDRAGAAKLTVDDVLYIRANHCLHAKTGEPGSRLDLARKFGVTRTNIHWIISKRNWSWVDERIDSIPQNSVRQKDVIGASVRD